MPVTLLEAAVNFGSAASRARRRLSAAALPFFLPHMTIPFPHPLCGSVRSLHRPLPGYRPPLAPSTAAQWHPTRWRPHRPPPPSPLPLWPSFPPPPMELFRGPPKPRGPPLQAPPVRTECRGHPGGRPHPLPCRRRPAAAAPIRPTTLLGDMAHTLSQLFLFSRARGEPRFWRGRRRWQFRHWGPFLLCVSGAHRGAGALAPAVGATAARGRRLCQPDRRTAAAHRMSAGVVKTNISIQYEEA